MNGGNGKRTVAIVAGALVRGLLSGIALSAPQAQANAVGDFFSNLLKPLGIGQGESSTATNANMNTNGTSCPFSPLAISPRD